MNLQQFSCYIWLSWPTFRYYHLRFDLIMVSFFRFIGTLLAFTHSLLTVAIPLEEWAQDVCGASVYGELVSILQKYDPAQAFCATVFPLQCTTSALKKRSASTTAKPSVITKLNTKIIDASSVEKAWATTKAPSNTEVSGDSKVSAWLRLLSQGQDVISTVCSCIQDHRVRLRSILPQEQSIDIPSSAQMVSPSLIRRPLPQQLLLQQLFPQ